jgi:hypothetical protein
MWNNVKEFADWYVANKFPLRPPFGESVYATINSYSFVLYREGRYQAELYLVCPNSTSPDHSHPGVENVVMILGGDVAGTRNGELQDLSPMWNQMSENGTSALFGAMGEPLTDKDVHSLIAGPKGGAFISFEKWPDDMKMSSVTANWKGAPLNGDHQTMIDEFNNTK